MEAPTTGESLAAAGRGHPRAWAGDARALALAVLEAALGPERRPAEETFARLAATSGLDRRDRAFARRLYATALRRLGELDRLMARYCPRRPRRRLRHLLRLGLVQLVHLATPPHAAVATSVALARRLAPAQAAFVNAVLRRAAREHPPPLAGAAAVEANTPAWLFERWCETYGRAQTLAIGQMHLEEPPLDLRPLADAVLWAERLGGDLLPGGVVRLARAQPVESLPGYGEGAWIVQDVAAGLPACLLGARPHEPVLDLCAAPGGKTVQLAAAGARVVAVDISRSRMERLRANLTRTRLIERVELVAADARSFQPAQPFARVLLDAPCTATGTIRRHPDILWTKQPEDVARMAALQDELLEAAVRVLAPGGRLVYAVCSLQPEEGDARITALLARHPELEVEPPRAEELAGLPVTVTPAGFVRTLPSDLAERGGMDGFFIARLRRGGGSGR